MPNLSPGELLTTEEAAILLNTTARVVRRLVRDRLLASTRVGLQIRIRRSDIDAYLTQVQS